MFPIIRNYCVEKYHWIEDQDIDDILVVTNSIPGTSSIEAISYIALLLLKSKWKSFFVTCFSLLPHTILFFTLFAIGTKFIPMAYLKVIYVAVIPVIIALLLNMTWRYIKSKNSKIPTTLHWLIFVITTAFSVFAPVPWGAPIFIIVFFILCIFIYRYFFQHKKGIKND